MLKAFMKMLGKRRSINGLPQRFADKACPFCGAKKSEWCKSGCKAVDVMDYR